MSTRDAPERNLIFAATTLDSCSLAEQSTERELPSFSFSPTKLRNAISLAQTRQAAARTISVAYHPSNDVESSVTWEKTK